MPEAIVYVLRQVHSYFGDRPEVGKFFQSRDGSSIATFFTATARKQGDKTDSGLVDRGLGRRGSASAAMLYDEKARFGTTEPAMMQALSLAWHPAGGVSSQATASTVSTHRGGVAPLTVTTGGDHSARHSASPPGGKSPR